MGSTCKLVQPVRNAAFLAAVYGVLGSIYIVLSDTWLVLASDTIPEILKGGMIKGVAFVCVSSLGLFALAWWLLRRVRDNEIAHIVHARALVESERRALAALVASSVAHDINNNLMVASSVVHQMGDLPQAAHLEEAVRRIADLSQRLIRLGRQDPQSEQEPVALRALAEDMLVYVRQLLEVRRKAIQLTVTGPEVVVANHRGSIEQAVFNLLLNASQAVPTGGSIEIRTMADTEHATLEVHDSGPGIPSETRERILSPFYTTRTEGTGLGLFSVQACAALHGGRLEIADSPLGALVSASLFLVTAANAVHPTLCCN